MMMDNIIKEFNSLDDELLVYDFIILKTKTLIFGLETKTSYFRLNRIYNIHGDSRELCGRSVFNYN